jgi:hypothetical protein
MAIPGRGSHVEEVPRRRRHRDLRRHSPLIEDQASE